MAQAYGWDGNTSQLAFKFPSKLHSILPMIARFCFLPHPTLSYDSNMDVHSQSKPPAVEETSSWRPAITQLVTLIVRIKILIIP